MYTVHNIVVVLLTDFGVYGTWSSLVFVSTCSSLQASCIIEELTRLMGLSLGEPIPAYSRREQTSYR